MGDYILVMVDKGEVIYIASGDKEYIDKLSDTLKQNTTKQYYSVEISEGEDIIDLRDNSLKLKDKFRHLINKTI